MAKSIINDMLNMINQISLPERKFAIEGAVKLHTNYCAMLKPDQIYHGRNYPPELDQCHIYLIGRRPSLSIDPKSFSYSLGVAFGHLIYKIKGKEHRLPFYFPFDLTKDSVKVIPLPYPHRGFQSVDNNGKMIRFVDTLLILRNTKYFDTESSLFYDIVYVGQSYADGKRSALKRLRSHSTLQKVLAETAISHPDDEIMLFLLSYAPQAVMAMIDGVSNSTKTEEEDIGRWMNMIQNPIGEKAEICIAEAALIRYFQPFYNSMFKELFPHKNQKILDECYNLDFSAVIVEINTEDIGARIYSSVTQPGYHHIANFDLHDPAIRRSFFTFISKDGKVIDGSGIKSAVY